MFYRRLLVDSNSSNCMTNGYYKTEKFAFVCLVNLKVCPSFNFELPTRTVSVGIYDICSN